MSIHFSRPLDSPTPRVHIIIIVKQGDKLQCNCGQPLGYYLQGEYRTRCRSCKAQITFKTE